jgi:hypothetical protein
MNDKKEFIDVSTPKRMYECVITEINECPYDVISGKLCFKCKIPDRRLKKNENISEM